MNNTSLNACALWEFNPSCEISNWTTMGFELFIAGILAVVLSFYFYRRQEKRSEKLEELVYEQRNVINTIRKRQNDQIIRVSRTFLRGLSYSIKQLESKPDDSELLIHPWYVGELESFRIMVNTKDGYQELFPLELNNKIYNLLHAPYDIKGSTVNKDEWIKYLKELFQEVGTLFHNTSNIEQNLKSKDL